MFGLSTLNSNRTNHKLCKKLANQKRRHMSLRLCLIRTRHAIYRRFRASATQVTYIVWLNKTEPESESAAFPRFSGVPGLRRTSITCQTENSKRPESRQKQQSLIKPTNNALNVLCAMQIIQTIRTVTSTSTLKGIYVQACVNKLK